MQALGQGARNAALLFGVLIFLLLLMSWQVNSASTLSTARGVVFGAMSPLQRVLGTAWGRISGTVRGYGDMRASIADRDRLRSRMAVLERENARLREEARATPRLRELAGLRAATRTPSTGARVIARDFGHRYEALTIDRGSLDGVMLDAVVLSPDSGLIGRVIQLGSLTSMVQLITDPLSGVGARLADSRSTGLIAGLNGPHLELRYIETHQAPSVGEGVITSGEDGIYPPGLPLGRVRSFAAGPLIPGTPLVPLARDESALFLDIVVTPLVDVQRVEQVLILDPTT